MSDDDKLSFLDQKPEPEAKEAEPEPTPQAEPEPAEPKTEPEPPAQNAPDEEAEPQSADPSKPGFVPLDALLSEREKRKEYERRLSELEQRDKQANTKAPDPIDDPEGYARHQQQAIEQTRTTIKLETSEEMMRDRLGDAEFDKMADWWRKQVENDPYLVQKGLQQRNPWKFVHDQFKRNSVLSEVGTDLEAYRKKIVEEERAKWEAEMAKQQPDPSQSQPQTRQPPPSLASRPQAANAKDIPVGSGQAFDQTFKR